MFARGHLRIDPARYQAWVGETEVALTAREAAILDRLMRQPDQVVPRPVLADAVFGAGTGVSDRTLDSHLRNLRAKLGAAGCATAIETVHGVGVRLGPCVE